MENVIPSFGENLNIAVIGASGGLGNAFIEILTKQSNVDHIYVFSRSEIKFESPKVKIHTIDITSEVSIKNSVGVLKGNVLFDIVIVTTGLLHDESLSPEKTFRDLDFKNFQKVFTVNTFGPALIAKYFLPLMPRDRKSVFACLCARVGSISDNQLGGWYAYRASKAALNMVIKNLSIEMAQRYKSACVVGLHPGTVDTPLSQPFQCNVKEGKLFTPEYSSTRLLKVINNVCPDQSGKIFAWDGTEVPA